MMPVVCWLWRGHGHLRPDVPKYGPGHVNALARMLARHGMTRLVCVCDDDAGLDAGIETIEFPDAVADLPSYYPKLWAFSEAFGATIGGRFLSIDLDCVVTGDLMPLTQGAAGFKIWNQARGEPYNSSCFTLEPHARTRVWEEFTPARGAAAQAKAERAGGRWCGDQSWIAEVLGPNEATWSEADGLIQYRPSRHRAAPAPGALAHFLCGPYDPAEEAKVSPWIAEAWR